MEILPVVLRARVPSTVGKRYAGGAISGFLQILQGQTDAFHELLSLVPPQSAAAVADEPLPGGVRQVPLVGGRGLLGFLPLVPADAERCLRALARAGGEARFRLGWAFGGGFFRPP